MKIKFIARKFNITDDVKERFQKKLSKLDKFFPAETEATVSLYEEKIGERVEITIRNGSTIFRAEQTDKDVACALDDAMDVLGQAVRSASDDCGGSDFADESAVARVFPLQECGNRRAERSL